MKVSDYSSFAKFCYCVFKGYSDMYSSNYYLGQCCERMSYSEMHRFYCRFKETAQYVFDLDGFIYILKSLTGRTCADLTRELVLYCVANEVNYLKEEWVDELHSRYSADIEELLLDIRESNFTEGASNYDFLDPDDIPF